MLTDPQVTQFQNLYFQHFGQQISKKDALAKGLKLLRLIELTYRLMTVEEYERTQKRIKELGF